MTEASTHKGFAVELWSPKVTAYLKNLGAYADIVNKDYEHMTDKGIKGSFFRFMSRLTGKKALTQREQTKK